MKLQRIVFSLLVLFILVGCKKVEEIKPSIKPKKFIEFQSIGLSNARKQILLFCGPVILDTIVSGEFRYRIPVTQEIMSCKMIIKSEELIEDHLHIKGDYSIGWWSDCPYTNAEIKETFYYGR